MMKSHLLVQIALMTAIATCSPLRADTSPKVFNVKDYQAVGDGKTDDTAAIQKAINAAQAAGGGVVDFPTGTYLLNSNHPSSHPWFFYNLKISSNVTLNGAPGAKLLQGPGGRHALLPAATQVRNTVLAFGADYTVVRFQNPSHNGGFYALKPTAAKESSVTLLPPSNASHFKPGDYVAIYKSTTGDVIPTETSQITAVNNDTGVLDLKSPLARSFPAPKIANVTALATTNIGIQNLIVEGAEPLAVTEAFGFKARNCQFIVDTSIGDGNVLNLNLNTLHDFEFTNNTFRCVGPVYTDFELAQRNSQNGIYDANTFSGSNVGFGEYAAHIKFTKNKFSIHAGPKVVAGIFIGGLDVDFRNNEIEGGNITGGSGWGVMLADFVGPADYAPYVGQIRIANNTFNCRADGNACLGIFATDTSVTDNTITATGSARGIHVEGPLIQSNRIQGNKLNMDTGDGILIATPSTGGASSIITNNTINGAGANGIFLNAHGVANSGGIKISENTITGFATPITTR